VGLGLAGPAKLLSLAGIGLIAVSDLVISLPELLGWKRLARLGQLCVAASALFLP